jgi:hypothetical protein
MVRQKVLVVGGLGYFGRLLIQDLLQFADCDLIVASRRSFHSDRFDTVVADLRNPDSLERALSGVSIAICAAGPFQALATTLCEMCLVRNVHYIDIADDRHFVNRVRVLAAARGQNGPAVCTGWSTVSALSGVLACIAATGLNSIDSIHIQMAPGNRGARQTATITSLMHSVGQTFTVFRNRRWQQVRGWSEPRDLLFPPPVNLRRGYLVDVADHELLPALFDAPTVEFRTGSELMILNGFLSGLRWLSEKRLVTNWVVWSSIFQRAAALFSRFGNDCGALGVEVFGPPQRRVFIMAEAKGERMAVMPASVMTTLLIAGTRHFRGLVSPLHWLTREQLNAECLKRGFRVIEEAH